MVDLSKMSLDELKSNVSVFEYGKEMQRRLDAIEDPIHKELLSHHWFVVFEGDFDWIGCINVGGVHMKVKRSDMEALADKYQVSLTTLVGG